jgi:hypothetical protein
MWQLSSICSRGACWRVDERSDDAPACRDPAEGDAKRLMCAKNPSPSGAFARAALVLDHRLRLDSSRGPGD